MMWVVRGGWWVVLEATGACPCAARAACVGVANCCDCFCLCLSFSFTLVVVVAVAVASHPPDILIPYFPGLWLVRRVSSFDTPGG